VHIGTVPIDHELLNKIIENQIEVRREHYAGRFRIPGAAARMSRRV